jgi:hypothetical protein
MTVEDDELRRRFLSRRADGPEHPEAEVDDVGAPIADSQARLREVATSRRTCIEVDASGDVSTVAGRGTAAAASSA